MIALSMLVSACAAMMHRPANQEPRNDQEYIAEFAGNAAVVIHNETDKTLCGWDLDKMGKFKTDILRNLHAQIAPHASYTLHLEPGQYVTMGGSTCEPNRRFGTLANLTVPPAGLEIHFAVGKDAQNPDGSVVMGMDDFSQFRSTEKHFDEPGCLPDGTIVGEYETRCCGHVEWSGQHDKPHCAH